MAARLSQTKIVGAVCETSGIDVMWRYCEGFRAGAKFTGQSERVIVEQLGTTTLGNPFLMAVVASENTIRDLEKYRAIQHSLALPFATDSAEAARLVREGKTVVLITLNIHSTEIAASQESLELVYDLATSQDQTVGGSWTRSLC